MRNYVCDRKILQQLILLAIALLLLLFCLFARSSTAETLDREGLFRDGYTDPYIDDILQSRSFSNLIVSIQADESILYDETDGLISGSHPASGMDGEHKIRLFVYDESGRALIVQGVGIRVSGADARKAARKSYRIIAREEYDKQAPDFTYDLWGGRTTVDGSEQEITAYSSFTLHAVRLDADATGIHNSAGYSLAKKAGVIGASPTTPAALYINGSYQGAYFILPSKTDNALAELYNIEEKDDIEVASIFDEEKTGSQVYPEVVDEYLELVDYILSSDLSDPDTQSVVESQLDVEQFLQYYAVNLLLGNGDWIDNNLRVWRCQDNDLPYQDGKWRVYLFDLDWIGTYPEMIEYDFWLAIRDTSNYNILPKLLENPDWRDRFIEIIYEMEESAFNEETIKAVFAEETARIEDEISYDYQSDAFGTYMTYSVESEAVPEEEWLTLNDWEDKVENFKSRLLRAPGIINQCIEMAWPEE
ncbi:MAG: CotH kinase family protein [Lachnospiraceae bacterium]|nr:CotH kinase family protein [Lachnospiraceae bacterium]